MSHGIISFKITDGKISPVYFVEHITLFTLYLYFVAFICVKHLIKMYNVFKDFDLHYRGLVFICHGAAEHCLYYTEIAMYLIENGFYVFGHDHGNVRYWYANWCITLNKFIKNIIRCKCFRNKSYSLHPCKVYLAVQA